MKSIADFFDDGEEKRIVMNFKSDLEGLESHARGLVDVDTLRQQQQQQAKDDGAGSDDDIHAPEAELALKNAVANNSFHLRDSVGQSWARAKKQDPEMASQYAAIKGYVAQRAFRMAWAKGKYDEMRTSRLRVRSHETSHTEKGTYEPISMIWKREGKDSAAVAATKNYVERCIALGGKWVKENEFTKRLEFLYCKVGIEEATKDTHILKQEQNKVGNHVRAIAKKTGASEGGEEKNPQDEVDTPPTPNSKNKPRLPKPKPDPVQTKVDNPSAKDLKDAQQKNKELCQSALARGQMLLSQIAESDDWAWARAGGLVTNLQAAKDTLDKEVCSSEFMRAWFYGDAIQNLTKRLQGKALMLELASLQRVSELAKHLANEMDILHDMQTCRARQVELGAVLKAASRWASCVAVGAQIWWPNCVLDRQLWGLTVDWIIFVACKSV